MLLLRLWNYIRGYVIIIIEGNFLEKFINICIHRQIFLWDIKKVKDNKMMLKMSIKGFLLVRSIAKKTGCKVRIKRKIGVPFLLHRYKGRKTFVFGGILALILIYTLTSFIWVIEVSGNKKIETGEILKKISAYGVSPGRLKYRIDTKALTNKMMLEVPDLAWISITVKGTKLKVNVAERVKPPDLILKEVPCDIIAQKSGVVSATLAKAGSLLVRTGDMVKSGDVLISGTITSENKEIKPYLVHAIGSIYASTWYEKTCLIDPLIKEKVRTGREKKKYALSLFTKRINLFRDIPQGNYEKIEVKKTISIGNDLALPFGVVIDQYIEVKTVEKEITFEEAKKMAVDKAYKEALEEIPENVEIKKTNTTFFKDHLGKLNADVIIECRENIGFEKAIGGN